MTAAGGPDERSLDEILASIREIVEHGAPQPDTGAAPEPPAPPPPPPLPPAVPELDASLQTAIRDLIEPQVTAWLAANLPELVERITREEIARLTGG